MFQTLFELGWTLSFHRLFDLGQWLCITFFNDRLFLDNDCSDDRLISYRHYSFDDRLILVGALWSLGSNCFDDCLISDKHCYFSDRLISMSILSMTVWPLVAIVSMIVWSQIDMVVSMIVWSQQVYFLWLFGPW